MAKNKTIKKIEKKMDLDENKKNYIKNYILLVILFVSCIFLTIYFCRWYEVYQEYEKETPVIRGSLSEITIEDLDHYVVDNSSAIIYICTAKDDECRNFEKDFKKYIRKNDITDEIVYLNITGVDQEQFIEMFNKTYPYKIKLNGHYPTFAVFEDGKLISLLQGSTNKKLTISKVQDFIELNLMSEEELEDIEKEA